MDRDEVEDLLSTVLLRAWEGRQHFRSGRPLEPWLFTIARNLAFDHLRRRARVVAVDMLSLAAEVQPTPDSDEGQRAPESIREQLVRTLVAGLDPIDREILEASTHRTDQQEHWTEELALRFDLSPGALRVRKHRLLKRLARELTKAESGEES